ncbi:hypothetical protein BVV00_11905 [Serratia sp. OMLW3]|nr:hypothetical protein BVV00_11905 [Serratia sp. OMLW3]PIJ20460.1 hypothetical protein BVU99_02355 [Serratia sp. OLAL2]
MTIVKNQRFTHFRPSEFHRTKNDLTSSYRHLERLNFKQILMEETSMFNAPFVLILALLYALAAVWDGSVALLFH